MRGRMLECLRRAPTRCMAVRSAIRGRKAPDRLIQSPGIWLSYMYIYYQSVRIKVAFPLDSDEENC
jgi:hypothetical protein